MEDADSDIELKDRVMSRRLEFIKDEGKSQKDLNMQVDEEKEQSPPHN